jgi:hypothetical protein
MSPKNIHIKTKDTGKLKTYSDLFAPDIRNNSNCRNIMNKTTYPDYVNFLNFS